MRSDQLSYSAIKIIYILNDSPHPHVLFSFGFLNINLEEAQAREKANLEPKIQYFNEDPHEESSHIEKLFWGPVSVLLDNEERLFITETNRHRIQVYERTK